MQQSQPPPREAARAPLHGVVILAAMIVTISVDFNLSRAKTLREEHAGLVDPRDQPNTPTDLQAPRNPQR